MDTQGNVLEKPSEWHARHEKAHLEQMATNEEYRKTFEAFKKAIKEMK